MRQSAFVYKVLRRLTWYIGRLLPIDNNKILLSSYYGRGYSDNLKYIAEELLKDKKYRLIWVVNDEEEASTLPEGITPCFKDSIDYVYQITTSAIWIDNCRKEVRYKKKRQMYIQTWHGGGPGKKCEQDVETKLSKEYVKASKKDAHITDIMISSDRFVTNLYHTSFWYSGPVAETGCPRYDILFKKDHSVEVEKIRQFFNLEEGTSYILYAPTFRRDLNFDVYNLDYARVIETFEKKFSKKYVVLVHLHPNVATKFTQLEYNKQVINATVYPDMQELMAASDALIGDYSSVNYEFSLMKKPVFRFAVDIDEYRNDRDMYLGMDEYPYSLADDNDKLICNISLYDEKKYLERLEEFFIKVGTVFNPHASKDCADLIRDYYKSGLDKMKFFKKHRDDFIWSNNSKEPI